MVRLLALFAALLLYGVQAQAQLQLRLGVLNNGLSSHIRQAPSYIDARVLAASTNESHTIPVGARYVVFSATCAAFYARLAGTATVPAGDVTDGTASELNPAAWLLSPVSTSIGLIAPTACTVTMSWYTI